MMADEVVSQEGRPSRFIAANRENDRSKQTVDRQGTSGQICDQIRLSCSVLAGSVDISAICIGGH